MRTGITAPVWAGSIRETAEAASTLRSGCWLSSFVSDRSDGGSYCSRPQVSQAGGSFDPNEGVGASEIGNQGTEHKEYVVLYPTIQGGDRVPPQSGVIPPEGACFWHEIPLA